MFPRVVTGILGTETDRADLVFPGHDEVSWVQSFGPHWERSQGRTGFLCMETCMNQLKAWLSVEDQIALLRRRGMHVPGDGSAEHLLSTIAYYRLSGYWYLYRQPDPDRQDRPLSTFVDGATLSEVKNLYDFDRRLKLLILSGIERIEVALRARLGHVLGSHGALCYEDPRTFRPTFLHAEWLNLAHRRVARTRKSNDEVVLHHDAHYDGLIPIWVLTDMLDFADISKLYKAMFAEDQRQISQWLNVIPAPRASKEVRRKWASHPPLANWLENLTVVRNICAHHGRLWNRQLPPVGTPPRVRHLGVFDDIPESLHQVERVRGTISIITHLMKVIAPESTWSAEVDSLITNTFIKLPGRSTDEMLMSLKQREKLDR